VRARLPKTREHNSMQLVSSFSDEGEPLRLSWREAFVSAATPLISSAEVNFE
jgi:hypothetical protein